MKITQYENAACLVAMQQSAFARAVGGYSDLAFFRAVLPDGRILRVTRSHDAATSRPRNAGRALWHLSASVGIGNHGTLAVRRPSDAEAQEIINQLGSPRGVPVAWNEDAAGQGDDPFVRHFWETEL